MSNIVRLLLILAMTSPAFAFEPFQAQVIENAVVRDGFGDWRPEVGSVTTGQTVTIVDCAVDACIIQWPSEGLERAAWIASTAVAVDGAPATQFASKLRTPPIDAAVVSNIRTEGDSYMAGAYGFALNKYLKDITGRQVVNTAVGGSAFDAALERFKAPQNRMYTSWVNVIWDGSNNDMTSVAAYVDQFKAAVATLGHDRFVIIPPARGSDLDAVAAALEAQWPDNFLDWRPIIAVDGKLPKTALAQPQDDSIHLGKPALMAMAGAINDFIKQKGW